jgi:PAS domain S-box-containing protein
MPGSFGLKCPAVIGALAGLAGYAINILPIDSLAPLWLGRVFSLLAAILFGPWSGALAALISSLSVASASPTLIAILFAEGLIFGAVARWKKSPIIAVVIVSGMFSVTMVLVPDAYGLPDGGAALLPHVLQRLLGFMLAMVLADVGALLIRTSAPLCGFVGPTRPSLRGLVFHGFVLAATIPVLLVSAAQGHAFSTTQRAGADQRIVSVASTLAERVDVYVDTHLLAMSTMAAAIGHDVGTVAERNRLLQHYLSIYPGFRAVAFADRSGLVHEIQPANLKHPGLSIRQYPFFQEAISSGRLTVSDVTASAVSPDSVVFVGAPITAADGTVTGLAYGTLSLEVLSYFGEPTSSNRRRRVIVSDLQDRVIFATASLALPTGHNLRTDAVVLRADESPENLSYRIESKDPGRETMLGARSFVGLTGWSVFALEPESSSILQAPLHYLLTLLVCVIALCGSIIGARALASSVANPLESLVSVVRNLSLGRSSDGMTPRANAPVEIATLVEDVDGMQHRLSESYLKLEQVLGERERLNRELERLTGDLENKVVLRTAELGHANGMLHNIITALPGALLVADAEGRVRLCNETAAMLLGRSSEEVIGLAIEDLFDHADDGRVGMPDQQASDVMRAERTLLAKGGDRIAVLVSTSQIADPADSTVGGSSTVYVAIDIRDRKALETELQQAQKLESVGRLAAGVAHEINTPVQFVSDSVYFLRDSMHDMMIILDKYHKLHDSVVAGLPSLDLAAEVSQAERDVDLAYVVENVPAAIDRSVDGLGRVATIVRSMKEFAHPDQREMIAADINQCIESTLVIARNEYKYVADLEKDLAELPRVVCYPGDINQVVLNIVINAAHAIEAAVAGTTRRGRITIRTRAEEGFAVISVSDTGGGIPEAIRGRIFDPFFTTKGVGKGTGQGLAIARSVVLDKHKGRLTCESETGTGTTFVIHLPIDGWKAAAGEVAA